MEDEKQMQFLNQLKGLVNEDIPVIEEETLEQKLEKLLKNN